MNGVGIDTHGNATVVWSTAQPDFSSVVINTARRELDDGVWGAGSVVATTTAIAGNSGDGQRARHHNADIQGIRRRSHEPVRHTPSSAKRFIRASPVSDT